jgi:hypothetical protein
LAATLFDGPELICYSIVNVISVQNESTPVATCRSLTELFAILVSLDPALSGEAFPVKYYYPARINKIPRFVAACFSCCPFDRIRLNL